MKHRIITVIIAIMALIVSTAGVSACDSGLSWKTSKHGKAYTTRFYSNGHCVGKVNTSRKIKVKVVSERKVKASTVNNRRGRYILVEKIKGKCISDNGDGKTSKGYYIRYNNAHRGDKFTTYAVYNDSKYIDDISIRVDIER